MTGIQKHSRAQQLRELLAGMPSGATALELRGVLADARQHLTRAQIDATLRQLHSAGVVRMVKHGRGVRWFAADSLLAQAAPPTPFHLAPTARHAAGAAPVTGYQRQSIALHDATLAARQPLRDQLQADVDAWLRNPRNRIEQVPRGATGESLRAANKQGPKGPKPFVINPRKRAQQAA